MNPYIGIYNGNLYIVVGKEISRAGVEYYLLLSHNKDIIKRLAYKVTEFNLTDYQSLDSILKNYTWTEKDFRSKTQLEEFDEDRIASTIVDRFNKNFSFGNFGYYKTKIDFKYNTHGIDKKHTLYFKFYPSYTNEIRLSISGITYTINSENLFQNIKKRITKYNLLRGR